MVLSRVRDAYQDLRPIPCASCRPCMPCPEEIDVPRIFEIYNDAHMYGDMKTAYSTYIDERHHIENCTECRLCEERCVKRLPIVEWLKRISEFWH
jgi:predicted aldo/keto reductase-like oxidoreductase